MNEPLPRRAAADLRPASLDTLDPQLRAAVSQILDAVARRGEDALRDYAARFDGLEANAPLTLGPERLRSALEKLAPDERAVLERTHERVADFARAQRACLQDLSAERDGARMGHDVRPLPVAGCYAPGGRYPLPSSVIMTASTARVAGVETVVVASPQPAPVTLAAAAVAGADLFLPVGGAQAIAAMAFGVGPVPRCDAIVGPGNDWVTAAKELVAGRVRIDSLAGPSELVVVADGRADPAWIAADLLAQAEHDPGALPGLVALHDELPTRVATELELQLRDLPTADVARRSLSRGFSTRVDSVEEAVALCNRLAPEHLEWMVEGTDPRERGLLHYGALFLGEDAAEVLGDYGAGPNHVLPTGGGARARGGLSVFDFLKVQTWLKVPDEDARRRLATDADALARMEGLAGHARAARRRR